jgi:hypothetical protein
VFTARMFSAGRNCLCSATNLEMALNDDSEKHRDRPSTSHADDNCIIVGGFIREDRRFYTTRNIF